MTFPARDRAAAWVRDRITDGTVKPGRLIPAAREIADATGLSVATCHRALRDLAGEGILTRAPGTGRRLCAAGENPQVANHPTPARDRVTAHIRTLIADGTIKPGDPIPPVARLRAAAGVCHITCARAVDHLTAEGVLIRPARGMAARVTRGQP